MTRWNMRHLQQLKYIDTVARVGSIRRAADSLAITSTALNRRILAAEEDLGTPIFERLPNGVRLSVAGELYIQHIRQQLSDMERVRSQIADLSGERRGHVSVCCGQALMLSYMPSLVTRYRSEHRGVTFSVSVADRQQAALSLMDFSSDVAVIFEPEFVAGVQVMLEVPQRIHAIMRHDHPLATRHEVRLSECEAYALALPSQRSGIRHLLDRAAARLSLSLPTALESDSTDFLLQALRAEPMIAFQIPVAFSVRGPGAGIVAVPVHPNDIPAGKLQILQQKGRNLPVAAARFTALIAEQLHLSSPEGVEA